MVDPRIALAVAGALTLVLLAALRLRRALRGRWHAARERRERVAIEDALKHLHDFEEKRLVPTLQSLAGVLSLSHPAAVRLGARLAALGLLASRGEGLTLTAAGREEARRVIRIHRLWERYLADRTGLPETEWHSEAEQVEHQLSPAEAEALAAAMGHPRFDPHGDPIPTAAGDLPVRRGFPLPPPSPRGLAGGIHLEGEPEAGYRPPGERALLPGCRLRVEAAGDEEMALVADGRELVLSRIEAANVTVAPLPPGEVMGGPYLSLAELAPGERGRVIALARTLRGTQRRRLLDLGIVPGTPVAVEMRSASGDPTAYEVRGATLGLRREQAAKVLVERMRPGAAMPEER